MAPAQAFAWATLSALFAMLSAQTDQDLRQLDQKSASLWKQCSKISEEKAALQAQIDALKKQIQKVEQSQKIARTHSVLVPNLIKGGFDMTGVSKVCESDDACKLEVQSVHPWTQAFEGPYCKISGNKCRGYTVMTDDTKADDKTPYIFGSRNCGPRSGRGGLADGWGSRKIGKILKMKGKRDGAALGVSFTMSSKYWFSEKALFRAHIKVVKGGAKFQTGTDIAPKKWEKVNTTKTNQGWQEVDELLSGDRVSAMAQRWVNVFMLYGEDSNSNGAFEVYLALPYLANVFNHKFKETGYLPWVPAVGE